MTKPLDAWWTVLLVDPFATRLVPRLARRSWISPTRVTVFAHLLGLVAVALFATGRLVPGALVFQARFVADCIDGKLARVTGRTSRFGQLLDTFGDRALVVACVGALGWRFAPAAVTILAATYPLYFHLLETQRNLVPATELGAGAPHAAAGHGWQARLARRRLYPIPTSVDVEHLLLVAGPLLWGVGFDAIRPLLWLAAGYFVLQSLRSGTRLLTRAAALDRAAARATDPRVDPSPHEP